MLRILIIFYSKIFQFYVTCLELVHITEVLSTWWTVDSCGVNLLAAYPWFDPLERFTETRSLFSLTSMRIFNMYKVLQVYLDEQIIEICSKSQLISFFLENLLFHFSKKRWEIEDIMQIKIGNNVIIGEKFVANSLYIQYSWFDKYQGIRFYFILE